MISYENCLRTFFTTLYPELNDTKLFIMIWSDSLTLNSFMKEEMKYSLTTAIIKSTSKSLKDNFFFYKIDKIGGKTSTKDKRAGAPPQSLINDHLSSKS